MAKVTGRNCVGDAGQKQECVDPISTFGKGGCADLVELGRTEFKQRSLRDVQIVRTGGAAVLRPYAVTTKRVRLVGVRRLSVAARWVMLRRGGLCCG